MPEYWAEKDAQELAYKTAYMAELNKHEYGWFITELEDYDEYPFEVWHMSQDGTCHYAQFAFFKDAATFIDLQRMKWSLGSGPGTLAGNNDL